MFCVEHRGRLCGGLGAASEAALWTLPESHVRGALDSRHLVTFGSAKLWHDSLCSFLLLEKTHPPTTTAATACCFGVLSLLCDRMMATSWSHRCTVSCSCAVSVLPWCQVFGAGLLGCLPSPPPSLPLHQVNGLKCLEIQKESDSSNSEFFSVLRQTTAALL